MAKTRKQPKEPKYKCALCGKPSDNPMQLWNHIRGDHPEFMTGSLIHPPESNPEIDKTDDASRIVEKPESSLTSDLEKSDLSQEQIEEAVNKSRKLEDEKKKLKKERDDFEAELRRRKRMGEEDIIRSIDELGKGLGKRLEKVEGRFSKEDEETRKQGQEAEVKKIAEDTVAPVSQRLEAVTSEIGPLKEGIGKMASTLEKIDCRTNPDHPDCLPVLKKAPEETKVEEEQKEEPEAEKVDIEAEVEKRLKEKTPKGVLGTDLTLEEFLKDEKSQKVFVEKYLGDAGMAATLERCTSKECQEIRRIAEEKGIRLQRKREGGGMLGGEWEEIE